MAKIENTTVYPLVTPNASDFIIGTDTSDDNRTVSFKISDITASGGLQDLQSVLDTPTTNTGGTAAGDISLTGNITVNGTVYPTTITAVGSTGTAGQLLSSTGAGIEWINSPALSCCTLEQTLTSGNSTTLDIDTTGSINMSGAAQALALSNGVDMTLAVNSDITTSGNIILSGGSSVLNFGTTAEINDSTGSTGAIGSILTVDAAGTGVEWSTGVPVVSMPTLQQVLTAGDTATANPMNLTVGSNLTLDGTSNIVSSGANSFTGTNTFSANGSLVTTAGVVLSGSLWDGANTGTSNQVLTSTVTGVQWKDVSAVGVSSVTTTTPATAASPQTPITINPTSGAVFVTQNIYNGGNLIGCVPDGGTNSTFLRGDGTWAAAAGSSAPEGYMSYLFNAVRESFTANNYYTLTKLLSTNTYRLAFDTDLGVSSPAVMAGAMTDIEHIAGCFLRIPTGITCGSAYPNMKVCDMDFQFVGDAAATGTGWEIQLWKTSQCTSGTYTLAGTASFGTVSADTLYCRAIVWESAALQTLAPGEAFFITVKPDTIVSSGDFQLNTSIRWKGVV